MSSTIDEQIKREKPDVEKRPVNPIVKPNKTGKGALLD